ncbi:MAG: phage tail assembly protein [Halomonas sp.]|uniref:phage tail assembly protein n=1 Tax=Halomonas sp. TaxID=1486246 RepID=UPI003F9216F2
MTNATATHAHTATAADPIKLDEPIKRGEQTIREITLRKPKSGELRGISLADVLQMQTDALITLIPRLSTPSLTAAEVRQMDPADLVQCGGEIAGFLLTKRAKGESE